METVAAQAHAAHAVESTEPGPLRVALVADAPRQPRWAVSGLANLAPHAELAAIVELNDVDRRAPWLWQAYCRLDRWAFGLKPDPMEPVALRTAFPDAPYWTGSLVSGQWRAQLESLGVDVLFVLGEVEASVLHGIAHYGVWRYCFGSAAEHDALAGIRELGWGEPVMPSGIKAWIARNEPERMLYQSWSRSFSYSLARTRDNLLPKTSQFAARALKLARENGEGWLRSCEPVDARPEWPSRDQVHPEEFASLAAAIGVRLARAVSLRAYVQQWFLAYRFGGDAWEGDFRDFTWVLPPKDRFWADPFPLERGGRHWIFFEELMFARRKAHISVIELSRGGARSQPVKVLERDYHLSYPFLIEHEGELFMIPETGTNGSIELYRCRSFPDDWTLEQVLLRKGFFTDATVHRVGDRWWLFANLSPEDTQGSDELNLYYADRLQGPWKPHRRNPVKSDVRGARPAGRLYEEDGKLYRPGQIGAPLYGSGIAIHQVLALSPDEYREVEVRRVLPSHPREVIGIHTLNRAGDLCVVDGFTRRPRLWD